MKSFISQRVKLEANRIEGDKQARWQLWHISAMRSVNSIYSNWKCGANFHFRIDRMPQTRAHTQPRTATHTATLGPVWPTACVGHVHW